MLGDNLLVWTLQDLQVMAEQLPRREWAFPIPCPACAANAGDPYRAETLNVSGSIRVTLRCRQCGHEWQTDLLGEEKPILTVK